MAISRDISRSRKAYSFNRPRPVVRAITTEEEMISINAAINNFNNLAAQVANLQANSDKIVWNEIPSPEPDGVNVVFTLAFTPIPGGRILVFVNGILKEQDEGTADYSVNGNTIVFTDAPMQFAKILVTYSKV